MNSMVALNELRAAKERKQKEKLQCDEIKKQLEKIQKLKKENLALTVRLDALSDGCAVDDLDQQEDPRLVEGKKLLRNLQEKLSAYRLIGPCGLTVVAVDTNSLVVTFTSMWRNVKESFILKIVAVNDQMKVSGTTIPYFIDVQSMLESFKSPDWHLLMDNIGQKLNAYIQRKGELDYVNTHYKDIIKTSLPNESVTSIELSLHHTDTRSGVEKEICIYLVYPTIDATLPNTVDITTENMDLPDTATTLLSQRLLQKPLSTAMSAVVGHLKQQGNEENKAGSQESQDSTS